MRHQHYIDVQVETSVAAEELAGWLADVGLLGSWEDAGLTHLYWPPDVWEAHLVDSIKDAITHMSGSTFEGPITVSELPHRDWNAEWAATVEPIAIGKRVVIRPSWKTVAVPPKGIELILDPKQAFGTGHHATTQLMIEWLEDLITGGESVFDIGTGSGVLAMIAYRLGARKAFGIDHDSVAVECARVSAQVNQCSAVCRFETIALGQVPPEPFDVILANLDRGTLLTHVDRITSFAYQKTILILSGILKEDAHAIETTFRSSGWILKEVRQKEQWLALELRRLHDS